ncbi:MAG: SIR2 family protein [Pseudomonadota bacterium]
MMEKLISKLGTGKAILFVGAGFSKSATSLHNSGELPLAKELANHIGNIGKFNDGGDLKFAADYFLNVCCKNDNQLKNELIDHLKNVFTIKKPHPDHEIIMKAPWKRVYTTNYDDLIEVSGKSAGKRYESITIDDPTEKYSNDLLCIHLNGSTTSLNEETLNTSFKLSHSSYLSAEGFKESNWNYIFKKDLELSSAIVFVGYSLYDIDIEKILYENPLFKEKVYFIQREKDDSKDTTREDYIFNKYGYLYRIGLSRFASLIEKNINVFSIYSNDFYTEAFTKYEIVESPKETIREKDIESFLRHGELSQAYIQEAMTSTQVVPFIIKRDKIEKLINLIENNPVVCITGELGNGKTYFLKEAELQLTIHGYTVYKLTDHTGNYISDIEKIISKNISCVLTIDSYGNHRELIKYLLSINLKRVKVLVTERTANHHSYFREFDGKLKTADINADILSDQEMDYLINILEHTSLWGKYGKYSDVKKKRLIKNDCKSQLSNVLVDVLNSKQIKDEISKLLSDAFKNEVTKLNIFIACLLDVMDMPLTLSLISDLSKNDYVLSNFANMNEVRHLFTLNIFNNSIDSKSSIYSLHLLNEHFEPTYIVKNCLILLKMLDKMYVKKTLDQIRNDIRINLFRFNFIELILPKKTKIGMLVNYYEEVKNELPFHITNPQYWLQYAMAHIALNNYDLAYRYLQTAYDKAEIKYTYDVHKINNQKARLNLKVATLSSTKIDDAINLFIEADNLLNKHENDIYKFKVVNEYYNFFESKSFTLNSSQRSRIRQACIHKLNDLENLHKLDSNNFKQEMIYQECETNLRSIISSIDS